MLAGCLCWCVFASPPVFLGSAVVASIAARAGDGTAASIQARRACAACTINFLLAPLCLALTVVWARSAMSTHVLLHLLLASVMQLQSLACAQAGLKWRASNKCPSLPVDGAPPQASIASPSRDATHGGWRLPRGWSSLPRGWRLREIKGGGCAFEHTRTGRVQATLPEDPLRLACAEGPPLRIPPLIPERIWEEAARWTPRREDFCDFSDLPKANSNLCECDGASKGWTCDSYFSSRPNSHRPNVQEIDWSGDACRCAAPECYNGGHSYSCIR